MDNIKVKIPAIVSKKMRFYLPKKIIFKGILLYPFIFTSILSFAQSKAEMEILNLSKNLFRFEVEGKMDSLTYFFSDKLVVLSSKGTKRGKSEYLIDLRNGRPVHNKIDVTESAATLEGTTAIVVGKGMFVTTVNENKTSSPLSYMEVFIKERKIWKLIALSASRIPE